MFILSLVLGIRQSRLSITRSSFNDIKHIHGLKTITKCEIDSETYNIKRIPDSSCPSGTMSITNSHFLDYYQDGNWGYNYGGAVYIKKLDVTKITSNEFCRLMLKQKQEQFISMTWHLSV